MTVPNSERNKPNFCSINNATSHIECYQFIINILSKSVLIFIKCVNRQDSLNRKRFRAIRAKSISTFSFDSDAEVQHKIAFAMRSLDILNYLTVWPHLRLFDSSCSLFPLVFHCECNRPDDTIRPVG